MRQYWDIKALHQDKILLFRMGDFFEMFFSDAEVAAPILGIALTQRNKKSSDETPMCGVPHHSIAGPINKLLKAGYRVAICDQIEDPKQAKGIVKRAVTRVMTPGMVYDPETLDNTLSNYIITISEKADEIAALDSTTGEAFYIQDLNTNDLNRLLKMLPVAEILLPTNSILPENKNVEFQSNALITHFSNETNLQKRLLSYVESTGGIGALNIIRPFECRSFKGRMQLSTTVLKHLEIFSSYRGGIDNKTDTHFFSSISRTETSAGARMLRSWILFPLLDKFEILKRQKEVGLWHANPHRLKKIKEILSKMGDIERRLSKIAQPQCNGRDLQSLAQSFQAGINALKLVQESRTDLKLDMFFDCENLVLKIENTLLDEQPLSTKQGHIIRKGFRADLDELIELSTNGQDLILKLEAQEKEKTGISSLKVRYNNVFGYYIEVTNTHKDKVPNYYLRKQTLANAERYYTEELIELEKKVLSSQTRRFELEAQIFEDLKQEVLSLSQYWLDLARQTAELDVFSSLAWLSIERKYVCPVFTKSHLKLIASRHPVVEQTVKKVFTPNDIYISENGVMLLTGPNMAGKSTLMRQVALTAILAQMGSFVPADEAELPIFDSIFTRVGASDSLSEGLSTFMVEMTETADMLKQATSQSLLIVDEIGRGTSTFDGMSLAQSILEYLATDLKATTLFATHYHELTSLSDVHSNIINTHMSVVEKNGQIEFLHTLLMGPAQKSYGIQVAKLAGISDKITDRARLLLKELEFKKDFIPLTGENISNPENKLIDNLIPKNGIGEKTNLSSVNGVEPIPSQTKTWRPQQSSFFESLESDEIDHRKKKIDQLIKQINKFTVNDSTPLQALVQISKWQKEIHKLEVLENEMY